MPFLENREVVFCEWNAHESSFDTSLPDLRHLIEKNRNWRAVVINDDLSWGGLDNIHKHNPYDFVDYRIIPKNMKMADEIISYREYINNAITKAAENPLSRIGFWFFGPSIKKESIKPFVEALKDIEPGSQEYFSYLKEKGITVRDAELEYAQYIKYHRILEQYGEEPEIFYQPTEFIAITERCFNMESYRLNKMWSDQTEFEYSRFYQDNLYKSSYKYLIYDIPRVKTIREESRYLNFLSAIMIIASNSIPSGVLRSERVYYINVDVDLETLESTIKNYTSKLTATLAKIEKTSKNLDEKKKIPLNDDVVRRDFEYHPIISVELYNDEPKSELFADYNEIGLATDCPNDESAAWDNQYNRISKRFIRFLRKPRRAIKSAVENDLRAKNAVDDDRIAQLNQFQLEDIVYSLEEEENNMVETNTTHIFNTKKFSDDLFNAYSEVKENIAERMTKKKTIVASLIALLAYLFGFLPLLISDWSTNSSFSFSLIVTAIFMVAFLSVGLVYLFVLRYKLIKKFKQFNKIMFNILNEIESSAIKFSKYLAHLCGVMCKFSILNNTESAQCNKKHALLYHKESISEQIKFTRKVFSSYTDQDEIISIQDCEPYLFDFTVMKKYPYEVPYIHGGRKIDYAQSGNMVSVPIDYVKSVTFTREELYD